MEVKGVSFEGGFAPTLRRERGAFGAANGVAIDLPPFGDGVENFAVFGGEGAVTFRADIQQEVATACGGLGEELDEVPRRFVGFVVGVVAVGFVGRWDGLPILLFGGDHESEFGGTVGGGVVIPVSGTCDAAVEDQIGIFFAQGVEDLEVQFLGIMVRGVPQRIAGW
jgi:hypothetical protein